MQDTWSRTPPSRPRGGQRSRFTEISPHRVDIVMKNGEVVLPPAAERNSSLMKPGYTPICVYPGPALIAYPVPLVYARRTAKTYDPGTGRYDDTAGVFEDPFPVEWAP